MDNIEVTVIVFHSQVNVVNFAPGVQAKPSDEAFWSILLVLTEDLAACS
jgi:hypothetical protein